VKGILPIAAMGRRFTKVMSEGDAKGAMLSRMSRGKSMVDALKVSVEVQKKMMSAEYQGYSNDKTIEVVFHGSLVPLKCEVKQAALDLGVEGLSQRVAEAMRDAHAKVIEGVKQMMSDITSEIGVPATGQGEECSVDSKDLACKLQQEVEGMEYTGSSMDEKVGVVFNGNLAPITCTMDQDVIKLGPEAVSKDVVEAMAIAYGKAVAGLGNGLGVVPPLTINQPIVFTKER
jgi:DNA-binding protein YbaB